MNKQIPSFHFYNFCNCGKILLAVDIQNTSGTIWIIHWVFHWNLNL